MRLAWITRWLNNPEGEHMTSDFIDDGYSEKHTFDPVENLYNGCWVVLRPMMQDERDRWAHAERQSEAANGSVWNVRRKKMVEHIESWSYPLPITEENLAKLKPAIAARIFETVAGSGAGDRVEQMNADAGN